MRSRSRPAPIMPPQLTTVGIAHVEEGERPPRSGSRWRSITEAGDDHRRQRVGQDLLRDDAQAWSSRRLRAAMTKSGLAQGAELRPHQPRDGRPRRRVRMADARWSASVGSTDRQDPRSTSRKVGVVWNSSTSRISKVSTQPPKKPADACRTTMPIASRDWRPKGRPAATRACRGPARRAHRGRARSVPKRNSGVCRPQQRAATMSTAIAGEQQRSANSAIRTKKARIDDAGDEGRIAREGAQVATLARRRRGCRNRRVGSFDASSRPGPMRGSSARACSRSISTLAMITSSDDEQPHAQQHREIARQHGFSASRPHARPAEQGLDHDRAAQKVAEMHAGHRRSPGSGVAQRVADAG